MRLRSSFTMVQAVIVVSALTVALAGCGKGDSGSSGSFPSITPPIKAATPAGLKGSSVMAKRLGGIVERITASLDIGNFKTDFFGTGPTVLFDITENVDGRIDFFNTSTTTSGCLTSTPVTYTISPAGQASPVNMYAQCSQSLTSGFTGDPGLIMIGKNNGITYVYDANGAGWVAAMATPDGTSYDVHAWYSVGIGNGVSGSGGGTCGAVGEWDDCSYGVAEVATNAQTGTFEMAAAGIGVGYSGVQFASDGTNTYGIGDDGSGTVKTLCLLSSDETTTATGGICSTATFAVTTAIGIKAGSGPVTSVSPGGVSWANSAYPTTPNVTLNGTSTDSVHFGPTTAPSGVTAF